MHWVGGWLLTCAVLVLSAPCAFAQGYTWSNFAGLAGGSGSNDGTGTAARFKTPSYAAVDSSGNVYVVDSGNSTIRKVTPAGVVSTLAGYPGSTGSSDGTGSAARFNAPAGVALDSSGNLYVADQGNYTIRKVTPAGAVTTLAGLAGSPGSSDGTGTAARFLAPAGVAVDSSGNIYVADSNSHTIRKVTSGGAVSTLAGLAGSPGSTDATGNAARFNYPTGVALDGSGNLYVADENNHTIRKVASGGVVTTFAGLAGSYGSTDATGTAARFHSPTGVAVDGSGNVYVADFGNNTIRKMTSGAVVTTLAGLAGTAPGSTDGTGTAARFYSPYGVAVDGSGNVYVADFANNSLRKVTSGGVVTTLAGLAANYGSTDGTGTVARFHGPYGVTVDSSGNVYVADYNNCVIRKVTSGGAATTLAGLDFSGVGVPGSTDGTGSLARFSNPSGVAADGSGNVYVADTANNTIRKVTSGGVVTTLVGVAGTSGSSDGSGSAASFNLPTGVAVDGSGNIYVADTSNHTIRKVTSGGVVSTLAGLAGSSGSTDATGNAARFFGPTSVAVDTSGNVYVADTKNHTIRKVTSGGVVTTLAGLAGNYGSSDGTGNAARFYGPYGVGVDGSGNVYVADAGNNTIRKVTPGGSVTTIGNTAGLSGPQGVAVAGSGTVFVADTQNNRLSMGVAGTTPFPSTTAASAISMTGATLNGTVSGNGYSTAVSFDYGLTTDYGTNVAGTPTPVTGSSATAVSAVITGLSPGTTYHFRVNGTSSQGTSNGSDLTFTTSAPSPTATTQAAASITPTGASLNGTINANGFSTAVSFDYGLTTAYGTNVAGTPTPVTGSSATSVSAAISGLSPGTTYHFRVNGTSVGGAVSGSDQTFTTSALPPTATTLAAAALSRNGATLNGTVNANGFSSTVSFDYGLTASYGTTVAGTPTPVTGSSATSVSAVISGLSPATTYHFRVNGTNSGGTTNGGDQTFTTNATPDQFAWTNFAGMPGGSGNADSTGSGARFSQPDGVAVDSSGNVYVADTFNHTIRKVTPAGVVGTLAGLAGTPGSSDGTGSAARFNYPYDVAVDTSGNVYVTDQSNSTIRKITPAGVVSTLAGQVGSYGSNDGAGSAAQFFAPAGLAVDASGNIYVADQGNHTIRKVTPAGVVSTLAGQSGYAGTSDGTGSAARFYKPFGVAVDSSGNVYVADTYNFTLRKVTPGGVVSTLAGLAGSNGSTDATGSAARFYYPYGVAVDGSGNVYVSDSTNRTIRKVTPGGVVSTLAGAVSIGSTDGTGSAARFGYPQSIAIDSSGNLYVADQDNNNIRKVTSGGVVTTLAGLASNFGISDGSGTAARFSNPAGVAVDSSGNLYVADTYNYTIRKVTSGGVVSTLAGLAGLNGSSDGTGSAASFYYPSGLAVDGSGNVYVADQYNNTLRKVTSGGVVSTLAGLAGSPGSSDATGSAARFYKPTGVAVDGSGNVYVADQYNHTIRKVTSGGVVSTLAGLAGNTGSSDGSGSVARFNYPTGVAVDGSGNVYVADQNNHTLRKVTSGGVVTTLAGVAGSPGSNDGTGSGALFNQPNGVAVDAGGNVYVADYGNNTLRKVTPAGVVTTIGGSAGVRGGANGIVGSAGFNGPKGIAVSSSGTVYVADTGNNRISVGAIGTTPIPTTATASAISTTGATLNGTVNANGSSTAVSFDYGVTNAYGTNVAGTPTPVTGSSATAVSAVISGLSPGTTYHFRVNGTSSQGAANGSDQTFTTSAIPPTATTLAAASITGSGATLNGTVNSNGSATAVSFDYGLTTAYGLNVAGTPQAATGNSATSVSATIAGLSPGTTFHFRVIGTSAGGTTNGTDQTFTTSGVAAQYAWTNFAGLPGYPGTADGTGSAARFYYPYSVAVDSSGNVYVADQSSNTIRKMTPGGVVSTLAGLALSAGSNDGTGNAARFNSPEGVAVDSSGNVYVADTDNHTIRKVTPGGVVSTLAGLAGSQGSSDGTGSAARFSYPQGVAVDTSGNVYVADTSNYTIRKVTPGGVVSTLAGMALSGGSNDGTGSAAQFGYPTGVAVDASGNVYVADYGNHTIRKVTSGGVVSTLAGQAGTYGSTDGTGSAALFYNPQGVAVDGSGNVYVSEYYNCTLRKVTSSGVVTTLAGLAGTYGSSDGTGNAARFWAPSGVAVDTSGNLYVADQYNHTIRKVTSGGVVSTLAGLPGNYGSSDGTGSAARFNYPTGVAVDGSGNVYVADEVNYTIRKVTPGGVVSTLAGLAGSSGSSDGTGSAARFNNPLGVAVDGSGNVYVADYGNSTIRKVTSGGGVSTLAGLAGNPGSSDGTGSSARFSYPSGVAVDSSGNVYVADQTNCTIRKISPTGGVSTLAGLAGTTGSSDGTGSAAQFNFPSGVAVDGSGNVYVADINNNTLRKVTPAGVVSTLAGLAGNSGSSDGAGSTARFDRPQSVAVDGSGNVYVADNNNNTIRKVSPAGVVTTIGGTVGVIGSANGTGTAATFTAPQGVAVTSSGTVVVADTENNRISMGVVGTAPVPVTVAASSISTTGATLNGTVNANGSSTAVSFDYGLTTAYGTNIAGTPTPVTGSSATSVSAVITGLSPGTTYHFRVNGASSGGTANGSDLTFTTSAVLPTATSLAATSISGTGATLNGTVNANGFSTAVSFDYGLTTAYGTNVAGTPTPVTGSSATAVSAVITGLSPGTTYHFRVNGTSSQGTANGGDLTFTTAFTPVSWRQQWFSTTSNTGSAADAADPFQTGVPNLVVFALLGQTQNPARVTASMLPQPQKSGGNFVYTFTQPAGVSNITYGAQYSPSLTPANWQPVTDTGSGTQHIFSVPVGSNTRIFMRLTLTNLGP